MERIGICLIIAIAPRKPGRASRSLCRSIAKPEVVRIDPQFGDGAHRFGAGLAFDPEGCVHHLLAKQQIGQVDFAQLVPAPQLFECGLLCSDTFAGALPGGEPAEISA